jgi:hypothetical protein
MLQRLLETGQRVPAAMACALAVTSSLWVSVDGALADRATCSYNPASRTVATRITAHTGEFTPVLSRDLNGMITLDDENVPTVYSCGGTVTSTDTVSISDLATGRAFMYVDVVEGTLSGSALPFGPGFTDEPGASDEIEFNVDLGDGRDALGLSYLAPKPVHVVLGGTQINLNAAESTGIDTDMRLHSTEAVDFETGSLSPPRVVIDGRGGSGTPSEPFQPRISGFGGKGNDLLIGGDSGDDLQGGGGTDVISGRKGRDAPTGAGGADHLKGGRGDDWLEAGPGDDLLDGGRGRDHCRGGAGKDKFRRCEMKHSPRPSLLARLVGGEWRCPRIRRAAGVSPASRLESGALDVHATCTDQRRGGSSCEVC